MVNLQDHASSSLSLAYFVSHIQGLAKLPAEPTHVMKLVYNVTTFIYLL